MKIWDRDICLDFNQEQQSCNFLISDNMLWDLHIVLTLVLSWLFIFIFKNTNDLEKGIIVYSIVNGLVTFLLIIFTDLSTILLLGTFLSGLILSFFFSNRYFYHESRRTRRKK